MDEHLPFLRAVAANPADDLPRLVFADFLEESGEPDSIARAHFIRAQIALTTMHEGSEEYWETEALIKRLMRHYSNDWLWDLPEHLHRFGEPQWRRGFIEFATIHWADFIAGAVFETVPMTRVQIAIGYPDEGATPEKLDTLSHIRRITHLRVGPHFTHGDPLLFLLLQARSFAGITHLDFSENDFDHLASFVLRFGEAAFARTLVTLNLSDVEGLDDAVGNALATSRGLESLDRLILKRTELSEPVRAMLRRRFGERVVF